MFTFRQRIFLSYLSVFLLFLLILYPSTEHAVSRIVSYQLGRRADELIAIIQPAPNIASMIHRLRQKEHVLFSRVTVLTKEGQVLYDSHVEKLLGKDFVRGHQTHHPEVIEAVEKGVGYSEGYSAMFDMHFSYTSKAFTFHDTTLIIRAAFPMDYVIRLTYDFQLGFLIMGSIILVLFSVMTWVIIYHLCSPIQRITRVVQKYHGGNEEHIPRIELPPNSNPNNDFVQLAMTLNSLSSKVRKQIDSLTVERNDRVAILEALIEGVIAFDLKGMVTFTNHTALFMMGFTDEDKVMHRSLDSHTEHPRLDLLVRFQQLVQQCQQDLTVVTETFRLDNNRIYLDAVAVPKDDGALLILQDQSAHYRVLEMRKDFIANASHELKTPITIIQGFAETLYDNPQLSRELSTEITLKIVKHCKRMDTIVKNLLTLADIENLPHSRLEECDLASILGDCRALVLSVYPDARVDIQYKGEKPFMVVGDPALLETAFKNLCENAAKYSEEPAEITVLLAHKGENITVSVSDKGVGIPEQDVEHVFDRFYTVNRAYSRKMGGSGLGLSIVKTVIEKHKGAIWATSKYGEGTTFTVELPKEMVSLFIDPED